MTRGRPARLNATAALFYIRSPLPRPRDGGERRALVPKGAQASRQPRPEGVHPGRRHHPLRLHPRPLVRRLLQRGDQQVAVSQNPVGN